MRTRNVSGHAGNVALQYGELDLFEALQAVLGPGRLQDVGFVDPGPAHAVTDRLAVGEDHDGRALHHPLQPVRPLLRYT